MKTNTRKFKLIKDKELRNKFLADQMKIGLRYQLRSLRDSQGLTQKDLADLIGTKQSVISRLEKKPERVSIPTLLDIAEALDVGVVVRFESIDTVIDWYSEPTQKKMTPQKSEDVLKELEKSAALKQKEVAAFKETGQSKTIASAKTGRNFNFDEDNKFGKDAHFIEEANGIKIQMNVESFVLPKHDYTNNAALS
jgi:transcriptional regulator with XRE-family HTH domain